MARGKARPATPIAPGAVTVSGVDAGPPPTPPVLVNTCEHVIAHTLQRKGKLFRQCDLCGETWPIERGR